MAGIPPAAVWDLAGGRRLTLSGPMKIMGILNVTPDSFSDGGRDADAAAAVARGEALAAEGADLIDVGGESTRPGAEPVSEAAERDRVLPVIRALAARLAVPLSVDTTKAAIAREALAAGAAIVNDVSACRDDPDMIEVIRRAGAGVVLMHRQGTPRTMQAAPHYADVVAEVAAFLEARACVLEAAGIPRARIAVDPGIGFGKTLAHNLALLGRLRALVATGRPVVVGLSRKRMLEALTGRPVDRRLAGSLAGLCGCAAAGVQVMRVHDVAESRDAAAVMAALRAANEEA